MSALTLRAIHEAKVRLENEGKHPAMLLVTETGSQQLLINMRIDALFSDFGRKVMHERDSILSIPIHIVEGLADDSFLLVDRETIRFWIYDLMERP